MTENFLLVVYPQPAVARDKSGLFAPLISTEFAGLIQHLRPHARASSTGALPDVVTADIVAPSPDASGVLLYTSWASCGLAFSPDETADVSLDNQTPVALGIGYGPKETRFKALFHSRTTLPNSSPVYVFHSHSIVAGGFELTS
ncbi:hypothetical protein [Congregibacter sp.]|uniref:hypothetical protein n=1 Tax=Congregibacter sp. TaxID=2744308 RepID=UPI003F6D64BE